MNFDIFLELGLHYKRKWNSQQVRSCLYIQSSNQYVRILRNLLLTEEGQCEAGRVPAFKSSPVNSELSYDSLGVHTENTSALY